MIFRTLIAVVSLFVMCEGASAQGREDIYYIQIKLNTLGANLGRPDGVLGPKTQAAINEHAKQMGFKPNPEAMIDFYQKRYWFETEPLLDGPLYEKVIASFEDVLFDPYSAKFKDIVVQPSGNICGLVNAKNQMGAYTGYRQFMNVSGSFSVSSEPIYIVMPPSIEQPGTNKETYFCWLDVDFGE